MGTDRVVNVCFHGVGTPQRELEPGEAPYWVDVDRFHRILDELASWPAVAISFDDGNTSDVEIALPALLERGLKAEFFVLAGRLESEGSLDAEAVQGLRDAGMAIGSHGMMHRSWRGMDAATRQAEFITARQRLSDVVGAPVDTAACPLGRYDRRVLADLRSLGYTRVFTSDRRNARASAWLQPRHSVMHQDTPGSVRAGAFDTPLPRRVRDAAAGVVKRWR
jgi:peptidoglycan/xylan/chitin deacetylase (PgdA/CDA1 family)